MTPPYQPIAPQSPPLPNRPLSPFTGYTRAHWEAQADTLLAGLLPYATPHLAQYRLPGRTGYAGAWSDGLEGYARSFLLAAFRIAYAQGQDLPGRTFISDLITRYATGLAAGTDPHHPEHWPQITDRSQPMVEAASIAIALHETRPWLWDHLPDAVRQRVAAWLEGFVGARPNDSNWRLFQVITEEFLASIGASYRQSEIDSRPRPPGRLVPGGRLVHRRRRPQVRLLQRPGTAPLPRAVVAHRGRPRGRHTGGHPPLQNADVPQDPPALLWYGRCPRPPRALPHLPVRHCGSAVHAAHWWTPLPCLPAEPAAWPPELSSTSPTEEYPAATGC